MSKAGIAGLWLFKMIYPFCGIDTYAQIMHLARH